MSSIQARLAGLTLLLLVLWGITSMQMRKRTADLLPTIQIAVEHQRAAGITVTRTKEQNGPVDIRNDAQERVLVSVPESWNRDEVRNADVASVTGEEPSLGFRRWSIPSHATVTFLGAGMWNKLSVKNISDQPLRLGVVTIDITHGTSTRESTLVDDEALLQFQ